MSETLASERLEDPAVAPANSELPELPSGVIIPDSVPDAFPAAMPGDAPAIESIPGTSTTTEVGPDASTASESLSPDEEQAVELETQEDAWDRHNDAELLGKSFRVRRVVQEAGTQTIKGWRHMGAKVRNAFATPGKSIRQFAFNRAKSGYQRKQARLAGATSQRSLEIVSNAKSKMERRGTGLKEHTDRMQGRVTAVNERANERRQDYINELKIRREDALSRKAVRAHLRSEGQTRGEARRGSKEVMAEMSVDFKHRLGGAAIVAEATGRKFAESKRVEGRVTRQEEKAQGSYDEAVHEAEMTAVKLSIELLPKAEQYAEELRLRLDAMREDDPNRNATATALQKANNIVATRRSELQYWQDVTEGARGKSTATGEKLGKLQDEHDKLERRKASAVEQRQTWSGTHDQDQMQLHETVRSILEPEKPKEKE